ncbi:MAG: ATP-binding protein [Acidobacteriota bacterium]
MRAPTPSRPRSFAPDPDCPRCEGRGWELRPDGGAGSARRCSCQQGSDLESLLAASGLPARYRDLSLERFDTHQNDPLAGGKTQLLRARKESQAYVERFLEPGRGFTDAGLLFYGPTGTGKTHLAAASLVEIIRRYRIVGRFVDFTTLVSRIQSTFDPRSPESRRQVLDPVMKARLLVLDELGAQKPTPWVLDVLYLVINTRYVERLPTLFTTNYALEEGATAAVSSGASRSAPDGRNLDRGAEQRGPSLESLERRIGARLVSRLCEMAKPIPMTAVEDFRRNVKMQQHRF